MEKSTIKLVLTQEVVEKLCEQNPEFRIELEQMALKWVKQSVIKPLVTSSINLELESGKKQIQSLVNEVFHRDVFTNTGFLRVSRDELDRLSKATADLVLKTICPQEDRSEFWAEVSKKRDAALADFDAKLEKYLNRESIEQIIISQVHKYMNEICANLSRVTDSVDREEAT